MPRRALLALALLTFLVAFVIAFSGGFAATVAGWRVSARNPGTAMAVGCAAIIAWLVAARRARAVRADLDAASEWIDRHAPAIAGVIAVLASAVAIRFGTFSAAGSDASGYLSEAAMLWSGSLSRAEPLAPLAVWPGGPASIVPFGWRAALEPGMQVPTYAPGLPLLMAVPHGLGGPILAWLVPASAAGLGVWACARLAMRASTPMAGLIAAAWLATSPTYLVQSFQPMSDVPAAAAWLLCWVFLSADTSRLAAAGLAAAVAVLIRPNLAPLAAVPALYVLMCPSGPSQGLVRLRRLVVFSAPVAIGGAFVAWLQWRWYGSPLMSGYGSAGELYSWSNVGPNLSRYAGWLAAIESPLLLLVPVAWWWPGHRLLRWGLVFAALAAAAYALYLVVEQWTYLRFLVPAIALGVVAASAVAARALDRLPPSARAVAAVILVSAVAAHGTLNARSVGAFTFAGIHARSLLAGRYLDVVLPPGAVVISGEQSGSMRYYTGRSIVRWDMVPSGGLASTLDAVRDRGGVWIVLDGWEEDLFRARHRGTPAGELDWPPAMEAGVAMRTRAWRVADRAAFLAGERQPTDRLR